MIEKKEISLQDFQNRFEVIGHIIDPFERYFNIGNDRITHRRTIIKAYYINSKQQQAAILENLENYFGLRKVEGICQIICFTKISDSQINAAFDFHRQTLEQYRMNLKPQVQSYSFFVKLLGGISKFLCELKLQQVEVDDIRPSNILIDQNHGQLELRLFYDQRQKNKCLSLDNLYLSKQRLEEWSTGNFGAYYFEDKIVFECGLLLLDLITEQIQTTLYEGTNNLNQKGIDQKLMNLEQKYQNKQLSVLIQRMLSPNPQQRPNLQQIFHSCSNLNQSQFFDNKSATKSASHSNYIDTSSNHKYSSTSRTKIFQELDFLLINPNTHPDVIQQLHRLKNRIDQVQFECKKYQDGSVYYGQLMGSIRQGLGIYVYAHGDIFFGSWINNSALQGNYIFQSGQTYQGAVKNGKHGRGLYRYANRNVYQGFWQHDLKQGKGEMQYANGDRYDGNWHKGKKHGFGVYEYSNGIRYEGNFNHGIKNGNCVILFPDKTKFEGTWQQCCIEGFGKMIFENGDLFEGNYQQSMKNGNGVFRWANNITYQGEFNQDSLSGKCLVHYPNNELYDGMISDGIKNGQGMYQYQNGDSFTGFWKNDQKWQGRYSFYDGCIFQGQFRDNAIFQGSMLYPNGDVYQGQFKYGQRDGIGRYTLANKQVIEGQWRADSLSHI